MSIHTCVRSRLRGLDNGFWISSGLPAGPSAWNLIQNSPNRLWSKVCWPTISHSHLESRIVKGAAAQGYTVNGRKMKPSVNCRIFAEALNVERLTAATERDGCVVSTLICMPHAVLSTWPHCKMVQFFYCIVIQNPESRYSGKGGQESGPLYYICLLCYILLGNTLPNNCSVIACSVITCSIITCSIITCSIITCSIITCSIITGSILSLLS
jgi:hypothetical protein